MKMPTLNARDRRALLLALAVLVPSFGWIWVARPMRASLADLNERIVSERDAFAREQSAINGAKRNPERKQIADSAVAVAAGRVFVGPNDVAAGATLVTYLGEVARKSHVWLASAATRAAPSNLVGRAPVAPTANTDGLRPLRVELRAESDFQGVLDFLDAIERGDKIVVIERLDVAKTLRAGEDDRETLSVSATVVGYALPMPVAAVAPKPALPVLPSTGGKRGP
ncbi:MAG: GspMb/PilO family protein [Gemmatimonadetes bacterium]|jgi:hypothetical protein|nr:GspMb/PilO family protein [Gemmatimonadota bacterium]